MKKICFIASTGGHFEQLMMLKPLMNKYESFIVTEKTEYLPKIDGKKIYYLKQVNRRELKGYIFSIKNFFQCIKILIKEKPTHVISTGAFATLPMCILGRIFGKKVIFIESFAKIDSGTITGKIVYKVANEFFVQWESMKDVYPNAKYEGGVY